MTHSAIIIIVLFAQQYAHLHQYSLEEQDGKNTNSCPSSYSTFRAIGVAVNIVEYYVEFVDCTDCALPSVPLKCTFTRADSTPFK